MKGVVAEICEESLILAGWVNTEYVFNCHITCGVLSFMTFVMSVGTS